MKLIVTRGSVCAGDDVDVPHIRIFPINDNFTIDDIAWTIKKSDFLPKIQGGNAAWGVSSRIPIAMIAQQWDKPKMILPLDTSNNQLDISGDEIRVHVTYYAQMGPDNVVDELERSRLKSK